MIFPLVYCSDDLCFFRLAPESLRETRARVLFPLLFSLCFHVLFCGKANLASTPPSAGTVSHRVRGSESAGTTPGTHNADEYRYSVLQTRCARLEQDLRATQGILAILRLKQPRPTEREAFLLEDLERVNSDLLCKLS